MIFLDKDNNFDDLPDNEKQSNSTNHLYFQNFQVKSLEDFDFRQIESDYLYHQFIFFNPHYSLLIIDNSNKTIYISPTICQLLDISDENYHDISKLISLDNFRLLLTEIIHLIDNNNNETIKRIINKRQTKINTSQLTAKDRSQLFLVSVSIIKEEYNKLITYKEKLDTLEKNFANWLENISHEIRTPLNSILGFTELINTGTIADEQKQNYLQIIKNKSKSLLDFIDDLSELTRLETRQIEINKSEINLPELFREIYEEYNEIKQKRQKTFDFFLNIPSGNIHSKVITDRGRLYQAIKLILDISFILTEKGFVQFGYEINDSKNILFYAKDTGKRLTKEEQKLLLNKLLNKYDTYDKLLNIIGLKYILLRNIIEILGGKLSLNTIDNIGNVFEFTIPYTRGTRTGKNEKLDTETITYNWKNKVILIAEDELTNYQFLEALLSETQAQLIHVETGAQAVEICRTLNKIDIILMDIKMPDKSGFDAIREIRQISKIPIIAQTAYSNPIDKERCFREGCNDYIVKPIDIKLFFSTLSKYLNE